MTRIAIQVPVKWRSSERCPNKNFRELGGVPLAARKLGELLREAPKNWDIWLDSESPDDVLESFGEVKKNDPIPVHRSCFIHKRHPVYAENSCNGIQLMNQFVVHHPDYDWYGQAFVTAPFLSMETMVRMADVAMGKMRIVERDYLLGVTRMEGYDSALTVHPQRDMIWHDGKPVNHDPRRLEGETRTQEMTTVRATHGFYFIRGDVARETGCRTGRNPLLYEVSEREAFDIDTEQDFKRAEEMLAEGDGDE